MNVCASPNIHVTWNVRAYFNQGPDGVPCGLSVTLTFGLRSSVAICEEDRMAKKPTSTGSVRKRGGNAERGVRPDKTYFDKNFVGLLQELMNNGFVCDFFYSGGSAPFASGTIHNMGNDWVSVKFAGRIGYIPISSIAMVTRSAS
jgi:hypothetical protein